MRGAIFFVMSVASPPICVSCKCFIHHHLLTLVSSNLHQAKRPANRVYRFAICSEIAHVFLSVQFEAS
uniref:Putative secreted protein n=1 Tax=Anopheles marajoara TaxID=58244 RepID=A0A2M4CF96_9DIPT